MLGENNLRQIWDIRWCHDGAACLAKLFAFAMVPGFRHGLLNSSPKARGTLPLPAFSLLERVGFWQLPRISWKVKPKKGASLTMLVVPSTPPICLKPAPAPFLKRYWKGLVFVGFFLGLLWSGCFWTSRYLGLEALRQGSLPFAKSALGLANWLWPFSHSNQLALATVCRRNKDYAEAERHLNQCLKLEGGANEDVQIEFLLMRTATGEVDESSWHLMGYVDKNHPRSYEIMESITAAYLRRLKYGPAYALLNRMVELAPENALSYFWRGWVLERMDNPGEAKTNYLLALERDPSLVQVKLRLGEILLEDNRTEEAVPYLESLFGDFPNRPDVQARLGQLRFLQGRWPQARELLEAALPQLENDPALLIHLGRLDLQEDRPVEAEVLLRRILKNDPTDTEAQFSLVASLQSQGRVEEAKSALDEYKIKKKNLEKANNMLKDEAMHPSKSAQTAYEIGKVLLEIGRTSLGTYWLEQALVRDPSHAPSLALLAQQNAIKRDAPQADFPGKKN